MIPTLLYTIEVIREEASELVKQGLLQRKSPVYTLCQYIPPREWRCVECELERNDYLLKDPILDLLGHENWEED
jgi:uncharacterized protein YqgQ